MHSYLKQLHLTRVLHITQGRYKVYFSISDPFFVPESLISYAMVKAWEISILDPTMVAQPGHLLLKKTDPQPMACDPCSQGSDPWSYPLIPNPTHLVKPW